MQIEQYREQHAQGTMARLALELMLNIAARRHDAHQIGRQHLRFDAEKQRWKLTGPQTAYIAASGVVFSFGPRLQAIRLSRKSAATRAGPRCFVFARLVLDFACPIRENSHDRRVR